MLGLTCLSIFPNIVKFDSIIYFQRHKNSHSHTHTHTHTHIYIYIYISHECCKQYWISPGGNTRQGTNYTATYIPSQKPSKLDEPDTQDNAGEAGTSSSVMYSYGPPTYGRAKAGRQARTYIQQLCDDTECRPEDLPEAMNDREKWRKRIRDIRASDTTWWYIYIYIYILFWGFFFLLGRRQTVL